MGSAEIERVRFRRISVGAPSSSPCRRLRCDILGNPPYNFSRFWTPGHPFYLARQGPRGTLNSTAEHSLFLRRPISHQCQQERLQRAGVQLRKIHHSPSPPPHPSSSLFLVPSSGVSRIPSVEAKRDKGRRKQRDRRCARRDGERWRVDCLDPPRDGHRESPLQIDNLD